ncbi:carboxypeptidase-like regulatory domain-containing protein [Microlunatus sp. GCM10028923]|uniref:carboxypeptidase-like regulatory domain-containing protein n=1 Tax=Microlunatus sp. GCM10028923 TaxID=3273400 RepID=UPI00360B31C0
MRTRFAVGLVAAALILLFVQPAAAENAATLSGTITAAGGDPVPGAEAELCRFDEDGTPTETRRLGIADEKGRFMITGVPDGDYTFLFRDPWSTPQNGTRLLVSRWYGDVKALGDACWQNPQSSAKRFTVSGGDLTGLDGALPIGGRLIGFTNDTLGEPVNDLQVNYTDSSGLSHGVRSGWPTGGEYRTMLVLPGRQQVTFFDGRTGAKLIKTVEVAAGTTTRLDADFADPTLDPGLGGPEIRAPRTLAKGAQLEVVNPWYHPNATLRYTWLRDGRPIRGATDRAYRLTAADAGRTVGARVTASLSGHETVTVDASGPVRLKPRDSTTGLVLSPSSARGDQTNALRAQVHVSVESGAPAGKVIIWDDSHGEEQGHHIKLGEGRPNELGDVIIAFPSKLALDGGLAYAEFVPDDPEVNASYSAEQPYAIR